MCWPVDPAPERGCGRALWGSTTVAVRETVIGQGLLRLEVDMTPRSRGYPDEWEPVISGLVAADRGDSVADQALDLVFASLREHADWQQLVAVLRRIRAGERDPALIDGLDPVDTAIARRALAALAGTVRVDADVWRAGIPATSQGGQGPQLAALAAATVAAANGDRDAANALQPLLQALTAHPDWAPLAAAVRRIIVGERDPALADRLGHPTAATVVTSILNQLTEPNNPR